MAFPQIKRAAISLAVVISLYWVYSLVAVPLIEPAAIARQGSDMEEPSIGQGKPGNRHRELLAHYFNPTDWEVTQSPKVLDSQQGMLLVQDYKNLPDGRVELKPCTLIFFPRGADEQQDPAKREAIVMRAPQGAILKFDTPMNFKTFRIGKLVGGELAGEITIQSAPKRPYSSKDLHLATRDVQLDENRIYTASTVDFRLGPNHGRGRELVMKLAPSDEDDEQKTPGRIESLQLTRDVKMHLQMNGAALLPSGERKAPKPDGAKEPPLEIACQGPFHFELQSYTATFSDRVDVVRLNPQGPSDQMNCELLAVYFGPKGEAGAQAGSVSSRNMPRLEPRVIEARGNPVIVQAPSQQGHVRCQRLEYDVLAQRITLEGSEDVLLHQGANAIRTSRLDYKPESGKLGTLLASGPGYLQGHMPADPGRKYEARWSKELRLRPYEQEQVLSLMGAAHMQSSEFGGLDADEIHLWLKDDPRTTNVAAREVQPAAFAAVAVSANKPAINAKVAPDRMMAVGNVRLDSPQLVGSTDRLEVWIQQVGRGALPAGGTQAAMLDGDSPQNRARKTASQQFSLAGKLVRVQALSDGKQTQVDDVWVDGNASLTETKLQRASDEPLRVKGTQLHLAKASSSKAKVTVTGEPATIEGRGMSLVGGRIQLEQSTNRMWVEGPGRMSMPVTGDLTGGAAPAQPQTLVVTWQEGMDFDGRTVTFRRSVIAKTDRQSLRTETLQVRLTRPINFSEPRPNSPATRPEVEQVTCTGRALFDAKTFDQRGQSSIDRMQLEDLTVNRTSGAINGRGPGWLTTVRRGSARSMFEAAQPAKPDDGREKFSFLKVTFEKSVTGNLNRREVTLADQTRTVYGPVNDWNSALDADDPASLGMDGVLLTCDQLTVRTEPGAAGKQPPIELDALGHTKVEGRQGTVTADAHRLTYTQSKDMLILRGGGGLAHIRRQDVPGGPTSKAAAKEIRYWPRTNQLQGDSFQEVQWDGGFGTFNLPAGEK